MHGFMAFVDYEALLGDDKSTLMVMGSNGCSWRSLPTSHNEDRAALALRFYEIVLMLMPDLRPAPSFATPLEVVSAA